MALDTYTVWYQTDNGSNSGRKALVVRVESMEDALTQGTLALGDSGWTLTTMRDYNELVDKTGAAYIYKMELTQTEDLPA